LWRDSVALVQVVSAEVPALRTLQWLAKSGWLVPGDEDVGVARGPLADLAPLRVLGLGLANDQKKAEMWRAESVEVPSRLILDPDTWVELGDALAAADEASRAIRAATYALAGVIVGENPDPKNVSDLTNALDPTATYWGEMGRRYPAWLNTLTQATLDDDGRHVVRHAWADDVWEAAHIAFGSLTASLDRSADALRAVANTEPLLRFRLLEVLRAKRSGRGKAPVDVPTYAGQTWSPPSRRHDPNAPNRPPETDGTSPPPTTNGPVQLTHR
jgi:hypothetical protein